MSKVVELSDEHYRTIERVAVSPCREARAPTTSWHS